MKRLGGLIIGVVTLVTYYPALRIGFVGDDWTFVGKAAALSMGDYLNMYFNPIGQNQWYRPIHGVQFVLEYGVFRGDATGYHLIHILFHLANCLLLLDLVRRVSGSWRVGFLGALLFAAMSTFGWSVLWPAEVVPLQMLFYILTMRWWWQYLQTERRVAYVLAFAMFVLALLTKEPSVTLPVTLFLMDYLLARGRARWQEWARRYIPFGAVWSGYLFIEWYISQQSRASAIYRGYALDARIVGNTIEYLTRLAFPWALDAPLDYAWLIVCATVFFAALWKSKSAALAFLGLAGVIGFLPFVPFYKTETRFFYASTIVSALWLALLSEHALARLSRSFAFSRLCAFLASSALALIVVGNSLAIADRASALTDLARLSRAPLRAVSQRHPTLPPDTLVYFIDPFVPTADMSGMFFLRYGANAEIGGTDRAERAEWSAHNRAYVYWTDERGEYREQVVTRDAAVQSTTTLPVDFQAGIRLQAFEVASTRVKREEALVLLLYWQATAPIDNNYKVFAHLVNAHGEQVDGYDSEPQAGNRRTTLWRVGETIVDWIILPIASDVPAARDYRLQIGLYDFASGQRLAVVDSTGQPIADAVVVQPIVIEDR